MKEGGVFMRKTLKIKVEKPKGKDVSLCSQAVTDD